MILHEPGHATNKTLADHSKGHPLSIMPRQRQRVGERAANLLAEELGYLGLQSVGNPYRSGIYDHGEP